MTAELVKRRDDPKGLKRQLTKARLIVGYRPLADEIDPWRHKIFPSPAKRLLLPQQPDGRPEDWGRRIKDCYRTRRAAILLPGLRFDLAGTRRGRGGGWYDRFLACLPKTWVRVGFLDKKQLSHRSLHRQPWDEPVDWLVIGAGAEVWFWETGARQPKTKDGRGRWPGRSTKRSASGAER